MKLIKITKGGKPTWTPTEERLAGSIVYRVLRDAPEPMTFDQLVAAVQKHGDALNDADVRHALLWLRGKKVDVRVVPGRIEMGYESTKHPSAIWLAKPPADG